MECSFCGETITTKPVMLVECFGCGEMLPSCESEKCIDTFDCQNCMAE